MIHLDTTNKLIETALDNKLNRTKDGLLYFNTGKFTGRSPKDRYFVEGEYANSVVDFNREINQKISRNTFVLLKNQIQSYIKENSTLKTSRVVGFSNDHTATFNITTTEEWGIIFFNNMLINPNTVEEGNIESFTEWNLLHVPNFIVDVKPKDLRSENFVLIDFEERTILIAGTSYTGEIKKSIFTVMNTLLIDRNVLPMHCSANANNKNGFGVNLFFGLSGTGKTTLSSDLLKFFIGDDEHGWDGQNVFNFEGGCYAKLIDLEEEKEPIIWRAIHNQDVLINTSLLENVIVSKEGEVDYTDKTITENIRASYPLSQISDEVKVENVGRGNEVTNIFFLSFDAFGVLPQISLLDSEQAVKYFELGYTSKVAGTEVGINEPTTTFSACFGGPFLPREIKDYSNMFKNKLNENPNVKVWLVNTGFDKNYNRFSLSTTRGVINGVIDKKYSEDYIQYNGLKIPKIIGEYDMETLFEQPSKERQDKFFQMINK